MSESEVILKVENVSKQYRLGSVGTKTLSGDVHRWWTTKILGKEDPFLKVGTVNDRTSKEKTDFVWALRDINFEVKRGEVIGIIGKNGAGKSTLLKLLSRITAPTTGSIKSNGRMAALLEVGTGFHPELTGRENIFLNGAILGMTKQEIKQKFDEIVDFSGCALYIDTPVKRYSSGMTVRLGFAIAAFLDPEILIVDEVLAVGDAEFQKKAIGKMQDISNSEGRTVLFVSHNMGSVSKLCNSGIFLKNGQIILQDNIEKCISEYLKSSEIDNLDKKLNVYENSRIGVVGSIYSDIGNCIKSGDSLKINLEIEAKNEFLRYSMSIHIADHLGVNVIYSYRQNQYFELNQNEIHNLIIEIPNITLAPGIYSLNLWIGSPGIETYMNILDLANFEIVQSNKILITDQWKREYGLYYIEPDVKLL
jgi:lipopolysaccharide transport system ATP-binding protein